MSEREEKPSWENIKSRLFDDYTREDMKREMRILPTQICYRINDIAKAANAIFGRITNKEHVPSNYIDDLDKAVQAFINNSENIKDTSALWVWVGAASDFVEWAKEKQGTRK